MSQSLGQRGERQIFGYIVDEKLGVSPNLLGWPHTVYAKRSGFPVGYEAHEASVFNVFTD